MTDLIKRLEQAGGPDGVLDTDIYRDVVRLGRATNHDALTPEQRRSHFEALAPKYTASIDAALTLLPPQFWGAIEWAGTLKENDRQWPIVEVGSGDQKIKVQAKTIPLSICLAALRGRAAIPG